MFAIADGSETQAAIRVDLAAIFVSMELSKSTWLVTSLSPGSEKMSRHSVIGGDIAGLFACFADLRRKTQARTDKLYPLVVIQEAGLDGFWLRRVIDREDWIESYVVDAASIAVSRRRRRAKTDRIDGETLIRALMAYKRGEPRVCSMVRVPSLRRKIAVGFAANARRWSPNGSSMCGRPLRRKSFCTAMSTGRVHPCVRPVRAAPYGCWP